MAAPWQSTIASPDPRATSPAATAATTSQATGCDGISPRAWRIFIRCGRRLTTEARNERRGVVYPIDFEAGRRRRCAAHRRTRAEGGRGGDGDNSSADVERHAGGCAAQLGPRHRRAWADKRLPLARERAGAEVLLARAASGRRISVL